MRAPLSWLRELVEIPESDTGRDVADRLVRAGLEVETVDVLGAELTGPVVVGRVLGFDEEPQKNGRTIRWCQVDVGAAEPSGIVCGASNFAVDDLVVVALPGAVLPGDFAIAARKTYGHVSEGMICSARELGAGDDAAGIIVLPAGVAEPGVDAVALLELRDEVLDIAVTPDRGYCLSMRGVAREAATAYGVDFRDPADVVLPDPTADAATAHEVHVTDPVGADRIVLRTVADFDPAAPSPLWLQARLRKAGMRPVSLAVDVTNYVMLELGQPLHAFDRARVVGAITVRRARSGERLETLDHVERELHAEDLVIADESGPLALAGTMGGVASEVGAATTELVLESAHFAPVAVARQARRHRLPSEASRRFERGVDHELAPYASARAAALLAELGGGVLGGVSEVDLRPAPTPITLPVDRPTRTAGHPVPAATVFEKLLAVGCQVRGEAVLEVVPPSWRPDLTDPADLDEEVLRLVGYDTIPAVLPVAPAGRGLTREQRLRRRVGNVVAGAGYLEVLSYPFVGTTELDELGIPADDERRRAVRLANPLSDEQPLLRTTLLPGLLAALRRNVGRGSHDLALVESGLVFRAGGDLPAIPRLPVDRAPSADELAQIEAGLPDQPRHLAAVLCGDRTRPGWWGPARPASWLDALELARTVASALGVELATRSGRYAPWHPGRCAELVVAGRVVGHAGELHPRAVQDAGLPARTCAVELDLDALLAAAPDRVVVDGSLATFPVATQDVALVVDATVTADEVTAALRAGAGTLLESVRLFDVYEGAQIAEGRKSLAYALRFRAPDRTLTAEEAGAARDAAVAEAAARTGAELRS